MYDLAADSAHDEMYIIMVRRARHSFASLPSLFDICILAFLFSW